MFAADASCFTHSTTQNRFDPLAALIQLLYNSALPSSMSTDTLRITHDISLEIPDGFPTLRVVVLAYCNRVETAIITGTSIDSENGEGYTAVVHDQRFFSRNDSVVELDDREWYSYFHNAAPVIEQMVVWYYEDCEKLCNEVGRGVLVDNSEAAKLLLMRFCETWTAKATAWFTTVEWTGQYPAHEDTSCYSNSAYYLARQDMLKQATSQYRNIQRASDTTESLSLIRSTQRQL